jgi:tRNA nucleotidyltransferase (CCA-adding enzyme)
MATTILLEQHLTSSDLALVRALGQAAHETGARLYLVGGSVRDCILGLPLVDLDLTAEAESAALAEVLTRVVGGRVSAHSQFGTLKLELRGRTVDLATARREGYVRPGALPTVSAGTIHDDLTRRDFSINSMAIALWPSDWGLLLDPMLGRTDLSLGTIRVLHEASFRDDATRILRAIRYAGRLSFRIERQTLRWLRRDLNYLDTISPPRIQREMERALEEPDPAATLLRTHRMGALKAIHPALGAPEVARALRTAHRRVLEPLSLLGVLTYHADPQESEAVIDRLALTVRQRRVVQHVQELKAAEPSLAGPGLLPHQVVERLERRLLPAISTVAVLATSPAVRSRLHRYLHAWRHIKPVLKGDELQRLGVSQGHRVGQLLRELRNARLDGRIRSRRAEIAYIQATLGQTHRRV